MYSTPYPFLMCALQFCGCRLTAEEASAAAATNIIDKKMLWRYSAKILAKQMWQASGQAKKVHTITFVAICTIQQLEWVKVWFVEIYGINTMSDIFKYIVIYCYA